MGTAHTPGPLKMSRAKSPDNTGGFDYAVANTENQIVAEFYEHVGHDSKGGYVKLPAYENAALYIAAPDLLAYAQAQEMRKAGFKQPFGHDCEWCGHCVQRLENMRREAIRKATGGA